MALALELLTTYVSSWAASGSPYAYSRLVGLQVTPASSSSASGTSASSRAAAEALGAERLPIAFEVEVISSDEEG